MLIVLTGPSHSGKSTVIDGLVRGHPGLARVAMDNILTDVLGTDLTQPDAHMDAAYSVMRAMAGALLAQGCNVVVESTFTLVASEGTATFHANQIDRLRDLATRSGAPFRVIRLLTRDGPPRPAFMKPGFSDALVESIC